MVKYICRLCFKPKVNTIDIFSPTGINLGIDSVIRMHFAADEVRKDDDILPKSVCVQCWAKLADFHDFYNAVYEAESVFLQNANAGVSLGVAESNGNEIPNIIEVHYDSDGCNDDHAIIKSEMMDIDYVGVKSSTIAEPANQTNAQNTHEANVSQTKRPIVAWHSTTSQSTTPTNQCAKLISEHMNMTCFYCNLEIKTLPELTDHHQDEHRDENHFRVICCNTKLALTDILDHVEYHRNPNKYKCDKCDKKFLLSKELNKHERTGWCARPACQSALHPKFKCDICNRQFSLLWRLKRHIIVMHTKNNDEIVSRFQSMISDDSLSKRNTSNDHVRVTHEPTDRRVCHICGDLFNSIPDFRRHMLTHSNVVKPSIKICDKVKSRFQCAICKKNLSKKDSLTHHMKVMHEQRERRVCHICGDEFTSIREFRQHLRTHSDVVEPKVYSDAAKCPICGIEFTLNTTISKHLKTHRTTASRRLQSLCEQKTNST